jgi:lysophospholipase L1-like esterase
MATITVTSRGLGGGIVATAGVFAVLSSCVVNPVVGKLTKGPLVVDYADVLGAYFWWALLIGVGLFGLGRRIARGKSRADGIAVLALMIGSIVLFDRFLLARKGLPLWRYDPEVRYVHRPGIVRTLAGAGRPNDLVVINSWGHHDTEFPEAKPAGELRTLMLGDSVTMGFAVTYAETFSKQLEDLLDASDRKYSTHQVINAGVHGYSTFQEKRMLERSLRFQPDIIFIGFCMNDVTEPFVVDTEYGGTGLDYHGVSQTPNPFVGWLSNETGLGRVMQGVAARGKTREAEARLEIYSVLGMVQESRTSPRMQEAWRILLQQLGDVYAVARGENIPVVLVIFPYTFQLIEPELRDPQAILKEHAAEHGVDVIDTTDGLASAVIDDPELVTYLRNKGRTPEEIFAYHEHRMKKYFFDHDHFTSDGHAVVAGLLHQYLVEHGYVDAP